MSCQGAISSGKKEAGGGADTGGISGRYSEQNTDHLGGIASNRNDLSLTALNKFLLHGLKTFLVVLWYPIDAKTYSSQNL